MTTIKIEKVSIKDFYCIRKGIRSKNAVYKCVCGKHFIAEISLINNNHNKSCGCIYKKHGHSVKKTKTYYAWMSMKRRCYDENNASFNRYGKIGIKVCDRWIESFNNFLEDMGEAPVGMSLDRIDFSKDYSQENCRWATSKEQANNRSNNRNYTVFGKTQTLKQWCEEYNIPRSTMCNRIRRGWTIEDSLTKPIKAQKHDNKK